MKKIEEDRRRYVAFSDEDKGHILWPSLKLMSFIFCYLLLSPAICFAHAEETDEYEEGFLTSWLNRLIQTKTPSNSPEKGGKEQGAREYQQPEQSSCSLPPAPCPLKEERGFSAPKFGGYVIGSYSYSSMAGVKSGGFDARMIRVYVSGTVLRDFKYRIQMELKNPAMRDYTLEWVRFKEFQIKVGQFKRCFTYENPMNPWDVGLGSYSQLAGRMTALVSEDCSGEPGQNGRDQGLQLQGDLFPIGKDGHRLVRYQAAVFNGNGQNKKDNNRKKDWMGNIQLQPIANLYVGLFGWTGTYTGSNGVSVRRNRWAIGSKYDYKDWSFRAEYAHHSGRNAGDFDTTTNTWKEDSPLEADAWYIVAGVPITPWLKVYGSYDVYRKDATWGRMRSVYSVCPNFQLHKNLMFQVQYRYVNDRTAADHNYHELWAQTWVRF